MQSHSLLKAKKLTLSVIAFSAMASLAGCDFFDSDNDDNVITPNQTSYTEKYRPQLQYTASKNWLNDPNGLIYFDGEYHLFYQYNPNGNSWGDMSWGHAISTDLVHWEELPIALPVEKDESGNVTQMFFSGSAVVDINNTSGFGEPGKPAMVAIYTSLYPNSMTLANGKNVEAGTQAQSIAYSLDKGHTWKQYVGNPVIELPPAEYEHLFREFRDPKVFWYEPEKKWVMVAVLATERKAVLFESSNLIDWKFMSEFGPANAVGGVWECPDLFEMPIDGNPNNTKWVMVINLSPGGPAGGSGSQYFTGEFDGTTFKADDFNVYSNEAPSGALVEDFEDTDYTRWTATGDLVNTFLATGNQSGQEGVSGYQGSQLANTFVNGDGAVGTLTSPSFTITENYINLMVGGGNHPHNPNSGNGDFPAGELLFPGADFEGPDGISYEQLGWSTTGVFVGEGPATGGPGDPGFVGQKYAQSFIGSDAAVGTLISPEFEIGHPYINFVIGSGYHPYPEDSTTVTLRVDGEVVRTATGKNDPTMDWVAWDVADFIGQTASIEIIDQATGGWGHVSADHFIQSDEPALPRPVETTVNLIVDDEIIYSETGTNSETLGWRSWNVASLTGKQAQIRIVDNNTEGWGHILVDHIIQSDQPKKTANWSDYGSDFYAAVSWNDVPDSKRLWVGWMSNWNYANSVPTSPWRSAQTFVRELKLQTIDGRVRLTQSPTENLSSLRETPLFALREEAVLRPGDTLLTDHNVESRVFEIDAQITLNDATDVGFKIRRGSNGEETEVGYDVLANTVYIDRTKSGENSFSTGFSARHSAPLSLQSGAVKLRIIVDTSSVTVFGGDGEVVLTDQIFPDPSSVGMEVFSIGGDAKLDSLTIWPLTSIWADK